MTLKEIRTTLDRVNHDRSCEAQKSSLRIYQARSTVYGVVLLAFAALTAGSWYARTQGWIPNWLGWLLTAAFAIGALVYFVRFFWRVTYLIEAGRVVVIDNILGLERDYVICCNQEDVMLNPAESDPEPLIITRGPRRIRLPFSVPQGVDREQWLGVVRYYVGGAA